MYNNKSGDSIAGGHSPELGLCESICQVSVLSAVAGVLDTSDAVMLLSEPRG